MVHSAWRAVVLGSPPPGCPPGDAGCDGEVVRQVRPHSSRHRAGTRLRVEVGDAHVRGSLIRIASFSRGGTRSASCVLSSTSTVIHFSRAPTALRSLSLAVALSVATAGSGLPMCVSLLAQAAAPCGMHSGHNGAATHKHAAHLVALVAQRSGQACHQDVTGLGCAAGSTCPTGGPATARWAKVSVGLRAAVRTGVPGPDTTFVSYFAPPLSPPPQA